MEENQVKAVIALIVSSSLLSKCPLIFKSASQMLTDLPYNVAYFLV
jgi:hypothetical protein